MRGHHAQHRQDPWLSGADPDPHLGEPQGKLGLVVGLIMTRSAGSATSTGGHRLNDGAKA